MKRVWFNQLKLIAHPLCFIMPINNQLKSIAAHSLSFIQLKNKIRFASNSMSLFSRGVSHEQDSQFLKCLSLTRDSQILDFTSIVWSLLQIPVSLKGERSCQPPRVCTSNQMRRTEDKNSSPLLIMRRREMKIGILPQNPHY